MKRKLELGFSAFLIATFGFAVLNAREWPFWTRLFPLVIAIPSFALALLHLVLDVRVTRKNSSALSGIEEAAAELPIAEARRRVFSMVTWILCFFLAIWLLGFAIGVSLCTFLYLKLEAKESWWLALFLGAAAWGFVFGLFDWALHVPFPEGQLFQWVAF
ncbi:MAG: tripartite tricarboxylate transporter TctB family protein [Deltaproteobacteria bacterium]|nr:tripartite tricarboxylate transporter TctB family protein [Deltaproteobacteria bacterium]